MHRNMRIIIFLLLISFTAKAQFVVNPYIHTAASFTPDTVAKFNLSLSTNTVSGFTSLVGDPNTAIRSGTSGSVTLSSVATGDTYWTDNGTAAAGFVDENTSNGAFPAATGSGYFFHQSTAYPSGGNIRLSGLVVGATYEIHIWSNRPTMTDNRLTKIACIDNGGTEDITNINSAPSSTSVTSTRSQVTSGGTVYFFKNKVPNGSGEISFQVAAATGWSFGYVNAIIVIRTA